MFREGPGTREEFIKAEAEIELSKNLVVNKETVEHKNVENIEHKEDDKNSVLKDMFKKATKFAECFVKSKKEKKGNS